MVANTSKTKTRVEAEIVSSAGKYIAECFGTAVLVLIGCGAAAMGGDVQLGTLGIAFAFGLAVLAMAYAIGPVSGAHINPAVTLGALSAGRIGTTEAIGYIIAQGIGAVIGAAILVLILSGKLSGEPSGLGQNGWGEGYLGGYGMQAALVTEFVGTFIFVIVVLSATDSRRMGHFAGLAIGLTLVMIHIAFIPVTGVSVNPARSLGPALFAGAQALSQLWLFLVVPALAGLAAGLCARAGYIVG